MVDISFAVLLNISDTQPTWRRRPMMHCLPTRLPAFPKVLSEVSLKTWERIPAPLNAIKLMVKMAQSRWMQNNQLIFQFPEDFHKRMHPLVM